MPELDKAHFTCIGCGASVPVGSDLCPGCRHRFAGPDEGPSPARPLTAPAYRPPSAPSRTDLLESVGRKAGFLGAGCLTMVAACIAFVMTCSVTVRSIGGPNFNLMGEDEPKGMTTGLILGLLAALAVVAGSIYLNILASAPESSRRKADR
ncbi:hypothetical protein P12x_005082 [Tundrisphaera lichenicola]|uniref:hypothetical protein n=1 Tax=Tundrisphaera lichenicola TaxID=2029860 RepID=UPI003EBE1305